VLAVLAPRAFLAPASEQRVGLAPMNANGSLWYLYDAKREAGPYSEEKVIAMLGVGLDPSTLVRREGEAEWRNLRTHAPFAFALEGQSGRVVITQPRPAPPALPTPLEPSPPRASIEKRGEFIGVGCIVQGAALLLPGIAYFIAGPVSAFLGLLAALPVAIAGGRLSHVFICTNCKNKVASAEVTTCPTCRADLRK
jgi:hypothetical protein